jgi:bifunctional NMN adenylyltransferase/nudix hydrolase
MSHNSKNGESHDFTKIYPQEKTYEYDYAVFIGRFQPFHAGHKIIVEKALERAKELIIVLGSHGSARTARNPFTTDERISIIQSAVWSKDDPYGNGAKTLSRIHTLPVPDFVYNLDKWLTYVQGGVSSIVHKKWKAGPTKICLIGQDKDHTSYYLKLFPQWDSINVKTPTNISSTDVRKDMFENGILCDKLWTINPDHFQVVHRLFKSEALQKVKMEHEFVEKYKSQWAASPYPPNFNTVDAIVTQSGHILMVQRRAMPGVGLYALPGGFIHNTETITEAMIRELYEETRLAVPKAVVEGSIVERKIFDEPYRSLRGRTFTTAYHVDLRDDVNLPKVKGADDAEKAFWMPLAEFKESRSMIFEDHWDIVSEMLGI